MAFILATGYYLAQTVFQLAFSHVSHALGRKVMYLVGLVLFFVGATVASTGVPIDALIGMRIVQGIGAAGMFTMSAIVIVDMTQPRERAGWTSISQAFGALGNICGPLYAGRMFKYHHRPWVSRSVLISDIYRRSRAQAADMEQPRRTPSFGLRHPPPSYSSGPSSFCFPESTATERTDYTS